MGVTSRVTITPNWTSQPSPMPSVTPPAPELAPLIPGHASASSPLRNGAKSTGTIRPKAGAFQEHVIYLGQFGYWIPGVPDIPFTFGHLCLLPS